MKITSAESILTARSPFSIRITFNEEVFGFEPEDITVTNGKASDLVEEAAGLVYLASITPTLDPADVSVLINTGVVHDAAGNNNTASALFRIRYDSSVLTLGISSSVNSPTNTSPIPLSITFSERVAGFTLGDIVVVNGVAGNLQTADDTVFTLEITPDELGDVTVDVSANVVADALTGVKSNFAAGQFSITYDNDPPNVEITSTEGTSTTISPFIVTIAFTEEATGFTLEDITVTNGVASKLNILVANQAYTVSIIPSDSSVEVSIDIAADVVNDLAGNGNTAATPFTIWYGGETNGSVAGIVIDSVSLAPLAGVSVSLEGTLFMATTDADGEFSFTEVPAGYYILTVSHKDYLDNSADVVVFASPENSFEVELNPAVILSTVANTGWFSEIYPLADANGTFAEVAIETPVTIDFASLAFVKAEIVFSAQYHTPGACRVNTYINDAQQVYASTTLSGWWVGNNAVLGTFLGEYYATEPSSNYTVDVTDFIRNNPNSVYYFAGRNLGIVDVRMQNIQLIIFYR